MEGVAKVVASSSGSDIQVHHDALGSYLQEPAIDSNEARLKRHRRQ
ncbi:hypothetical protein [Halodurantibacterium flavum]|jgi:hypothetical protein|uniref:Uncharacterized protein n=1 Tax=Halodurantibacterium flavum TaxID=1382802 RepID=A0ABW4S8X9_9RHOB